MGDEREVRGAGTDNERVGDDLPPNESEQRASASGDGGRASVQPLDAFAFRHECEACGLRLLLTPALAYELGWDYPPKMGEWGVIGPRTCGNCGIESTVWWALAVEKKTSNDLTEAQYQTALRIVNEKDPYAPAR